MNNLDWFKNNDISKSMDKDVDVDKLSWGDLRDYARKMDVDLGKFRSRDDIEKQLKEG